MIKYGPYFLCRKGIRMINIRKKIFYNLLLLFLMLWAVTGSGLTGLEDEEPAGQEIISARTMTSKKFKQSDNTYTAEFYAGPVHYQEEDGGWREIDLRPRSVKQLPAGRVKKFG